MWTEKEKNTKDHKGIYRPCEIPLSDETTDSDETNNLESSGFLKTHSDRLKELSLKLSDRVYDSIGSMKGKVRDEITNVRNIFNERKDSLIPQDSDANDNEAYKSDTDSDQRNIKSDSEDECRYLEVLDDGSGFDEPLRRKDSKAIIRINQLDLNKSKSDSIITFSD